MHFNNSDIVFLLYVRYYNKIDMMHPHSVYVYNACLCASMVQYSKMYGILKSQNGLSLKLHSTKHTICAFLQSFMSYSFSAYSSSSSSSLMCLKLIVFFNEFIRVVISNSNKWGKEQQQRINGERKSTFQETVQVDSIYLYMKFRLILTKAATTIIIIHCCL